MTAEGTKVPLAVAERTTENAALATRLTANLRDRGLDDSKGVLFVVDGSKALSTAIRTPQGELSMFSTITTFGTPVDITVAELALETFFPANAETAARLNASADSADSVA